MKKLLAIVLSAVLLISILPMNVLAEGTTKITVDGMEFSITDGEATFVRCGITVSGEVVVPAYVDEYPVVRIEDYAFYSNNKINAVALPETIKAIGKNIFSHSVIEKISISAENPCFKSENNCIIEIATDTLLFACATSKIPHGIKEIASFAFTSNNTPTTIEIPNTVLTIKENAFYDCYKLLSVSIPNSVVKIEKNAFYLCACIQKIYITDLEHWCNLEFENDSANPLRGGDELYLNGELLTELVIPETITKINNYAFRGVCGLQKIVLHDNIKSIGENAFSGCSDLVEVNIPNSIETIGRAAFSECKALKAITLSDSLTKLENSVFSHCDSLESVLLGSKITSIGSYSFSHCVSLKSIVIPDSVTDIEYRAFADCRGLESIVFPQQLTNYGGEVIDQCISLLNIEFPKNFIEYGTSLCKTAWYKSLPDGLVVINDVVYSYKGTAPKTIVVPEGITKISSHAFSGCDTTKAVEIPKSVKYIGDFAFPGHYSFQNVYYVGSEEEKSAIQDNASDNVYSTAKWLFNCCADSKHMYDNACDPFCNTCTAERYELVHTYDNDTCDIDCNLCGYKKEELSHSFDNPVDHSCNVCNYTRQKTDREFYEEDIRYYINSDGTLTLVGKNSTSADIVIPEKLYGRDVVAIGNYAFFGNTAINSIVIPDSVTSIGENALYNCTNLKSISIGKGITSIPENTIYSCEALETITVSPENPKYHSEGNCLIETATKTLVRGTLNSEIPEDGSVTTIGKNAFLKLGIEGMIIPENITTVEERAFGWCEKLLFLMVKNNTGITFYQHAFTNCNSLEVVFFVGTIEDTANITVYQGNSIFLDAYWYLEACPVYGTHYIEDPCDETCVECGALVVPNHIYDDENDIICNGCGCNKNIPYIVTSDTYFVGSVSIRRIVAGTTAEEFLSKFNEAEYCKVFKGDNEVDSKSAIGTGMKVKITDGKVLKADYTVIVTGDTNGDGDISVTDMISIKSHLLGKSTLSDEYATAADTSGDREISITDFIQIKAKILGKGDIVAH